MYKRYFENKIEGYKNQDSERGAEIEDDEYVDVQWFLERMNGNCRSVILGLISKLNMLG